MSTPPVNLAGGVRMLGTATEGTAGTAANPVLWSDNATQPNLRYSDGTHTGVGSMFVCAAAVASKGDLAVFNGTNWLPLSVGSNTQVLTADSTQASGIKWAAGGGGGGTQGGTTSASHVPYASGANTLSDGEMSFNSGTHTYSLAASTILDWSGSSGAFKTTTGAATFGGSSNTFTNTVTAKQFVATGTPSIAIGAFLGTAPNGAAVSFTTGSTDECGEITFVTGTDAANGPNDVFTVTASTAAPHGWAISLYPSNDATAAYWDQFSTNTQRTVISASTTQWKFHYTLATAVTSTTYKVHYIAKPY